MADVKPHYTWAGTSLLIAAALIRGFGMGDWSIVLLVVCGVLFVLMSLATETDHGRNPDLHQGQD